MNRKALVGWFVIFSLIMGACEALSSCAHQADHDEPCGITIEYADSLRKADSIINNLYSVYYGY